MWPRWLLLVAACVATPPLFHLVVGTPRFDRPAPRAPLAAVDDVVGRIDAAWVAAWRSARLEPAPPADDLTIARRMSLALLGRIPSLEEIRRLEADLPDDRLRNWLAEIFANRGSADYVAERLARATVGTDDGPTLLYRRRRYVSWLADQLYANRPWDEIVRHLIADAGVWTDTPPVNFITIAVQPDSDKDPDPTKLAARVSRAFLGIRLDCAECHNHPFAPWKQRDFQSLAAFFAQTRRTAIGIRDRQGEFTAEVHETGQQETVAPAPPYSPELVPDQGTRRERLAAWVTSPANRPFARAMVNRAWAMLFGRGLTSPVDSVPVPDDLARGRAANWSPKETNNGAKTPDASPLSDHPAQPSDAPARPSPELQTLDILAADFVDHGFDVQRLLTVITATRAFRLDSRGASDDAPATVAMETAWAAFPLTRLRPEQVAGSLLQAATLDTISYESHIVVRVIRQLREAGFIKQYGDLGADEFDEHNGAMPQRLLMMNGELVYEKIKDNIVANATTQVAALAPDDDRAVEVATLTVFTRRPTTAEAERFGGRLRELRGARRRQAIEDLWWTLLNSTEFAWNH